MDGNAPILLTKQDVAKLTKLSVSTIDRNTTPRGTLKAIRIGSTVRYAPADVSRWVEDLRLGK